jgi:hypothetical protein
LWGSDAPNVTDAGRRLAACLVVGAAAASPPPRRVGLGSPLELLDSAGVDVSVDRDGDGHRGKW